MTTLTTILGGLAGTRALVGFGGNDIGLVVAGILDTTGSSSLAFSMPRDGIITSIAAYYSIAVGVSLVGSVVEISAQLFSSPAPDEEFAPIAGTEVILAPTFTGLVNIGDNANGLLTGLSIPVTAGTRLLFVVSARVASGIDIATILTGFVSGGVGIE